MYLTHSFCKNQHASWKEFLYFLIKIGHFYFFKSNFEATIHNLGFGFGCADVRTEPYMQVSHFWDLAAHPRGMHPFNPVMLGIGRDPTASSILTPHNSCDLTPPMRGTQQNRSLV